jgi:hypothetical protein
MTDGQSVGPEGKEAEMSVTSIQERRTEHAGRGRAGRVVAVVLEDGSVRPMDDVADAHQEGDGWAAGRVSGADWILWWERRSFEEPGA